MDPLLLSPKGKYLIAFIIFNCCPLFICTSLFLKSMFKSWIHISLFLLYWLTSTENKDLIFFYESPCTLNCDFFPFLFFPAEWCQFCVKRSLFILLWLSIFTSCDNYISFLKNFLLPLKLIVVSFYRLLKFFCLVSFQMLTLWSYCKCSFNTLGCIWYFHYFCPPRDLRPWASWPIAPIVTRSTAYVPS